jgi:hypothetical protein
VTGVAKGKISALVNVSAGNQPQVGRAKHLYEACSRWHRNVSYRGRCQFGIAGRVQKKRLVQEHRHRPPVGASCRFLNSFSRSCIVLTMSTIRLCR